MAKPRTVDVTLRTVTPLFMGGADREQAELRPSSIKGALRFWYRAAHCRSDGLPNYEDEARIFGGAGKGEGQGMFHIIVMSQPGTQRPARWPQPVKYLGYGVADGRPFIRENTSAVIKLVFRPDCADDDERAVLSSLELLCHFGGLGSRWRRGFGSVVCEGLPGQERLPRHKGELIRRLRRLLESLDGVPDMVPTYTAFSKNTRFVVKETGTREWREVLSEVGRVMQSYRSASDPRRFSRRRRQPDPAGVRVGKFKNDRDLIASFLRTGELPRAPRRAGFGLPHNYFFRGRGYGNAGYPQKAFITGCLDKTDIDRRASPLLIHVHKLRGGRFAVVQTFLPAVFLPAGASIKAIVKDSRDKEPPTRCVRCPDASEVSQLVHEYFSHLCTREHGYEEVPPPWQTSG